MNPDPTKLIEDYRRGIYTILSTVTVETLEDKSLATRKIYEFRPWDDCSHSQNVKVLCKTSNEKYQIREQCVYCGRVGQALSATANRASIAKVDFDPMQNVINEIRKEAIGIIEETFEKTRRKTYDNYLQSREWKQKTKLVLDRDGGLCKAQLPECSQYAQDVHHLTYTYFGNEPLFTLVSVCRSCHAKMTQMEGRHKR